MKTNTMTVVIAAASLAFVLSPTVGLANTPDTFTRHGLPIPGAFFRNKENEKPPTIAVSKSGQGIREQKQAHQTQVVRQPVRRSVYFHTPAAKTENHARSIEQVIKDQRDWYQMID